MKRWRGSYILRVVSVMSLSITGCLVASRSPAQTEILSYSGPNDATSGLLTGFGSSMAAGYFDDDSQLDLVVGAPSYGCLLYTSPSPRDRTRSRMPSSA